MKQMMQDVQPLQLNLHDACLTSLALGIRTHIRAYHAVVLAESI
jgi:hypothetical protein